MCDFARDGPGILARFERLSLCVWFILRKSLEFLLSYRWDMRSISHRHCILHSARDTVGPPSCPGIDSRSSYASTTFMPASIVDLMFAQSSQQLCRSRQHAPASLQKLLTTMDLPRWLTLCRRLAGCVVSELTGSLTCSFGVQEVTRSLSM